MIFKRLVAYNNHSPQSIMLQLGSRRCYLLKEDGELMTFDSCVCLNSAGNEEIYSISNRGFCDNAPNVIWPIGEDGLTDLEGVKALIQGMISKSLNRVNLNVYAVIQPQLTNIEIKAIKDSIDSIDYVKSSSIIFKPIAAAVGIGLDIINRILPPIYIVDMHCITRGHYTCSSRFQYGINLTTIIEGRIYESNWFCAEEEDVVRKVLSRIVFPQPSLYIIGDCDDIYLYCKHFNETGRCAAIVPDNPDCIALLGLKKMTDDEQYKRYFAPKDEDL